MVISVYDNEKGRIEAGRIYMMDHVISFEGFNKKMLDRLQRGVPYKEKLYLPTKDPDKFWLGVLEDWNRSRVHAEEIK